MNYGFTPTKRNGVAFKCDASNECDLRQGCTTNI